MKYRKRKEREEKLQEWVASIEAGVDTFFASIEWDTTIHEQLNIEKIAEGFAESALSGFEDVLTFLEYETVGNQVWRIVFPRIKESSVIPDREKSCVSDEINTTLFQFLVKGSASPAWRDSLRILFERIHSKIDPDLVF